MALETQGPGPFTQWWAEKTKSFSRTANGPTQQNAENSGPRKFAKELLLRFFFPDAAGDLRAARL